MFNVLKYYGFVEISTLFLTLPLLGLVCQFIIGFLLALKIVNSKCKILLYCRSREWKYCKLCTISFGHDILKIVTFHKIP